MEHLLKYCFYTIIGLIGFSFSSSETRIGWQENRPIQWEDFQGNPDYSDNFRDAVTASALKFTNRCKKDGSLEVLVSAEFVKDQSWVKEVARSDYHLDHERLHFDITELYARKFRAHLAANNYTCDDKDYVQDLVYKYLSDCLDLQTEYDNKTKYSLHRKNQAIWEDLIQERLDQLVEFSSK